jgi:flavin-dependent dehydrogenase
VRGGLLLAGDAAGEPHPAAGDGIAMALRAGRLAAGCILAALRGRIASEQAAPHYARAWHREFAARLRWAAFVHAALVGPRPFGAALVGAARAPLVRRALLARTRGRPRDVVAALDFNATDLPVLQPWEFR